jgi:hypothetical protein
MNGNAANRLRLIFENAVQTVRNILYSKGDWCVNMQEPNLRASDHILFIRKKNDWAEEKRETFLQKVDSNEK